MKELFANLFKRPKAHVSTYLTEVNKRVDLPQPFSNKYDIFHYLDFNMPQLQPIKLSLELGKEDKAFEQFFKNLKIRTSPSSLVNWWKRADVIQTLNTCYPNAVTTILDGANALRQHKFSLFSLYPIQADTPIIWNKSYELGAETVWEPGRTYLRAPLTEDAARDIYFVWELNRHRHFLDLGQAYWCTQDEAYAELFCGQIGSWIEQNPYPLSVNWIEPYEVALRGIFWLLGYAFFLPAAALNEPFFCHFFHTLLVHGHAIYDSLQHASAGDDKRTILAQATFLHLFGTVFPEYLQSKTWTQFSWDILQWRSPLLSLESLREESFSALITEIELYGLVLLLRKQNRYHQPPNLLEGLTSLIESLAMFLKPNGQFCRIGEEPLRLLFTGMFTPPTTFRALFVMATLLLKNDTFAVLGQEFDASLVWWFGKEGRDEFASLPKTHPPHIAPESSSNAYTVMRSGWTPESSYCLFMAGIQKSDAAAELQHGAPLSFELAVAGHDYLIDSGPYAFHPNDSWNHYFRSLQAHNCITVDRISHFNFVEHQVACLFDHWLSTPTFDFVSGYHTGFEDLAQPIRHRRSIFFYKPNYWILSDFLTGQGQHLFDQYFHFPPIRLNVDFMNKCVDIQLSQDRHFVLMPLNPTELDVAISTGGESPDSGWISGGYKNKIQASVIKYGKHTSAPTSFHTLLYAYQHEQTLPITGRSLPVFFESTPLLSHEVSALEISIQQETHFFVFQYDPKYQQIQFETITFRGALLFLKTQHDDILEINLDRATFLQFGTRVLFQAETPVETMTLQIQGSTLHVQCVGHHTFRMGLPMITEVFVNHRKAFLRHENDGIRVSTARI